MSQKNMSRRRLLKLLGLGVAGTTLAACQPKVVKETVVVEKEKVVKEEVEVEKEVTRVVEKKSEAAEKPEVTIRYTTFWPGYRVKVLQQALTVFKEQEPHINVQVEPVAGGEYREKLTVQLAGGQAADAFQQDIWKACRHVDEGLILPLNDYVEIDGIDLEKDYYLFATEIWEDGTIYAMPYQTGPTAYYYNKYVLEEAGVPDPWETLDGKWSLQDLREWCRQCTMDTNGDGEIDKWGLSHDVYSGSAFDWLSHLASYGGRFADHEAGRYVLDEPKTIEAFGMIYDMYMEDESIIPLQVAASLKDTGIARPFAGGIVAFQETGAGKVGYNRENNPGEWDLLPHPGPDRDTPGIGRQSSSPNSVWSKTKLPDESYEVIKFLAGPVMQNLIGYNKLVCPQLKSAADDPDGFLSSPPEHISVMAKAMGRFVPFFYHWNTLDAYSVIGEQMELIFLGEKPLEEGLKEANRRANELVKFESRPRIPSTAVLT